MEDHSLGAMIKGNEGPSSSEGETINKVVRWPPHTWVLR